MKKNQFIRFAKLCLAMMLSVVLAACSENTLYISDNTNPGDGSGADASETVKGKIKIGGNDFSGVVGVETFSSVGTVNGSDFEINTKNTGKPMLVVCSNASDEITFIYRGRLSSTTPIEINERTTAVALLSLHPVFWSMNLDDYGQFSEQVSKLKGFSRLVEEVKTLIGSNRNLMSTSNESLIAAMNTCYEQLLGTDAASVEKRRSQGVKNAKAKAGETDEETDTRPIEFCPEAVTTAARVSGFAPVYECYTEHDLVRSESKLLLPHESYSWTDLYQMLLMGFKLQSIPEAWDDFVHGDWQTFDMGDAGDYYFTADFTTDAAWRAQLCYVVNDVFNLFGALSSINKYDGEKGVWLETSILNPVNQKEFDDALDFVLDGLKTFGGPNANYDGKWVESTCSFVLSRLWKWCEDHEQSYLNKGLCAKLLKGLSIVDGVSAFAGNLGRTYMRAKCPEYIQKCFSQHNKILTNCMGVGVSVISGNNQSGTPGQRLTMPVRFGVKCQMGQGIRLEVVNGGGTLDRYHKTIYQPDGSEEIVDINWTLGEKEGEQTIRAWVEDVITHKKQGLSCVVTATTSTGTLLTGIGNAYRFEYDENGRMTSVTDRTCMLAEPADPSEILKSTFFYKDDTSRELSRIVTKGDGETDTWYNIEYNEYGNIKHFKWSGSDEYGTEYGSGQFSYDRDGRINRIISYADDGATYLNFTWEDGKLVKMNYSDPSSEDFANEDTYISYGLQKNVNEQYPAALVMLDLGTLFFSGQVGPGPTYLPIQIVDMESGLNLDYTLRADGFIQHEQMRLISNPAHGFDFDYFYKSQTKSSVAPRSVSSYGSQPMKRMKLHKGLRMFGLRR